MNRIVLWLERRRPAAILGLGAAALGVVAFGDSVTGWELSFAFFYLIPVMMFAFLGRRAAAVGAVICGVAWLAADLSSGHVYARPELAYWNAGIRTCVFLVVGWLTAELLRESRRHQEAARVDTLTGVVNSRGFFERGELERKRATRSGLPISLAYLDLDRFKEVNDRAGHAVGDRVLATFGAALRRCLRATDLVARLGGDEFVLILPETGRGAAERVLRKVVAEAETAIGREYPEATVSAGLVIFSAPPETLDAMVRLGDEAMYAAKANGRHCIETRVVGQTKSAL